MSQTDLADVTNQIKKYWAPLFNRKLREGLLLPNLVSKEYDGQIQREGDTVYVSQVNDPTGELRTVGVDADVFATEKVSTTRVSIQANKRAVASYEFADLVELQSQIQRSQVMDGMAFAIQKQLNTYLYSLVSPSTSSPDHDIGSVTTVAVADLGAYRQLAAEAKWAMEGGWYALWSPAYWNNILTNTTLASGDFTEDMPIVAGQKARRLFGFNMFEDNSKSGKYGLLFHPDFLHLVMQQGVNVEVSSLHSQKRFGFVMSVDMVFGAALGIQGNVKHIKVTG